MINKHTAKFIKDTNIPKKLQVDGIPIHNTFNTMFIINANAHDNIINTPGDVLFPNTKASFIGVGNFMYCNIIRKKI